MDNLDNIIKEAIQETYNFGLWNFSNESEFQHELFHILANKTANDTLIGDVSLNSKSSIIHCEARPENGNNSRADLILCNPSKSEKHPTFNYKIEHILEIKFNLRDKNLSEEIGKLNRYKIDYKSAYIISANGSQSRILNHSIEDLKSQKVYVHFPSTLKRQILHPKVEILNIDKTYSIILKSIKTLLNKYGKNKTQFKSFFWCNYEKEISRGHSFPSEGDFNAYLYNELRKYIPIGIQIRSEYSIKNASKNFRIDFLITDNSKFMIPIEIKMNWDQFGIKHNKSISEANLILNRFKILKEQNQGYIIKPILVVIQGDWRIPTTNKKEDSLKDLKNSSINYEFLSYSEELEEIIQWKK